MAGAVIPQPEATGDFLVKGWGKRRGDPALVHTIPNHSDPAKPYQKGTTASEWRRAFDQLAGTGVFSRAWFNETMPACAKEGDCNFTTIGGIFQLLGETRYQGGTYRKLS